jgi:hypothetical protein
LPEIKKIEISDGTKLSDHIHHIGTKFAKELSLVEYRDLLFLARFALVPNRRF